MSFLSDLFHGNTSNLGHDLSSDPWGTAAAAASIALPFLAPAFLPELGGGAALFGGGEAAAGAGAGAGLDLGAAASSGGFLGGAGVTDASLASGGFFGSGVGSGLSAIDSAVAGSPIDSLLGFSGDAQFTGLDTSGGSIFPGGGTPISSQTLDAGGNVVGTWNADAGVTSSTGGTDLSYLTDGTLPPNSTVNDLSSIGQGGQTGYQIPGPDAGAGTGTTLPAVNVDTAAGGGTDAITSGGGAKPDGGSWFDKLVGGASKSITSNPIGIGLGAAGLGYSLLQGQSKPANTDQLQQQASQLSAQGQQLESYLQSGALPPGLQASMKQATDAAKAKIIASHASRGMPTDPTQNSALAQELASVDQQAIATQGQVANQLLTTGINETGLASNIYNQLIQIDQAQSKAVGDAIGNFAKAIGSGGGVSLKLA